ncbi:hypothetical protein ABPG74_022366 [Tetrahymena malaccensis]
MKLILALVLLGLVFCNPSYPEWPQKFEQDFTEEFIYGFLKSSTKGTYSYDYANKAYKVSRENGRTDRYCGFNGLYFFRNTACEQIVVNGDRFLYYPERNDCCYCCSNEHGCGVLKPTWLQNAIFEGETTFNGIPAYKWNQKGLQNNFYYETIAENPLDRVMLQIDQQPNDIQNFSQSRRTEFQPITLPSICKKENTCSYLSTCTGVRKM